jgi:exonuclease SbcC
MIPLRLIIHNFRAIEHADIDLSAVSLAAIAGRNGAGKSSAFTLAPRFALFGDVVSGVSLDDLVRRGASEMSVTFEFEHQGSVYRAIRTRSTKGKGKSTMELQKQVNGQWESRSAEKIIDTEAVIRNLLNLDDETFTASSMILQGQANAFTGATAGKRKEILSQILGLNVYEQLQESARQKAALLNIEIERAKDKLLTLDERLATRPLKEDELRVAEDQHSIMLDMILESEAEVKAAEAQLASLDGKKLRSQELDREVIAIESELTSLQFELLNQNNRLERSNRILNNETAILEKAAEMEQVKQEITILEARKPDLERLQRESTAAQAELYQLDADMVRLAERVVTLRKQLEGRDELKLQAESYEIEVRRLTEYESLADKWNVLSAEITDAQSKHDKAVALLTLEGQRLNDKIATLEQQELHIHDSGCLPTCKFQQAAAAAVAELPVLRRHLNDLDHTEMERLAAEIAAKQQEQQLLGYDYATHRACKVKVDELRQASTEYAQLTGKDELLQQLEQQRQDMQVRRAILESKRTDSQKDLSSLEEVLSSLPALTAQAAELSRWANLKNELGAAREAATNATERITAIEKEVVAKQQRQSDLKLERDALILETLDYDRLQMGLAQSNILLQQRRQQLAALTEQIGGIKAVLTALDADQQERDRLAAEMEPKALRWTRYQTLIKAFGRDGIPALIIENAVPQLERIANEILGQMSKGKHYVRFETQRELKSRAGVTETLDILIGDWTSERPYETFSGGEQLRIDYAIRFALAELLAQRAGNKVEWLTIDEGLGSQDAEHRALVLESIKSVATRFKRVLVITHIEDAQAAFDQVIRFDNSDGGVAVHVA